MKKTFLLLVLMLPLLSWSQIFEFNKMPRIEPSVNSGGPGKKIFYLNDGQEIKGKVKFIDLDRSVLIDLPNKAEMKVPLDEIHEIKSYRNGTVGSVGIGFGQNFGILGGNIELNLYRQLHAFVAVGNFFGACATVGAKWYPTKPGTHVRPHAGIYYGNNGYLFNTNSYGYIESVEKFKGLSCGLGTSISFGTRRSVGMDMEVSYNLTSGLYSFINSWPPNYYGFANARRVKLSFSILRVSF